MLTINLKEKYLKYLNETPKLLIIYFTKCYKSNFKWMFSCHFSVFKCFILRNTVINKSGQVKWLNTLSHACLKSAHDE